MRELRRVSTVAVTGSVISIGGTMPLMVLLARLSVVISLRQLSAGIVPTRPSDDRSILVTRR